jgi:diacylglycerol kinase family enzyme
MDVEEVRSFDDAYTLSQRANRDGYDVIVAVGGDGTINKVLNGFYDASGRRISRAMFGVVHTGTSPDFCKSYDIPLDIEGAVHALLQRRTRKIPVGMVRYLAADALRDVSYFVCCANVGLGASLATKANAGIRKRIGDTLGTFVSLLQVLREYEPEDYGLEIDGEQVETTRVYNMSVGLTPYIASGIRVANEEMSESRSFYLLTLRAFRSRELLPMLVKIYRGKRFKDTEYLSLRACRTVSFPRVHRQADIEHDGDPCGSLPCSIELAVDDLDVIY